MSAPATVRRSRKVRCRCCSAARRRAICSGVGRGRGSRGRLGGAGGWSGTGVSLGEGATQPLDRNVGVDLGGREAGVPEHLLHHA